MTARRCGLTPAPPGVAVVACKGIVAQLASQRVLAVTAVEGVVTGGSPHQVVAVAASHAVGTGIADDKAVYAYVPRIIKYYLDEAPILDNVQTHICREHDALQYTLDNLKDLVVKPVGS